MYGRCRKGSPCADCAGSCAPARRGRRCRARVRGCTRRGDWSGTCINVRDSNLGWHWQSARGHGPHTDRRLFRFELSRLADHNMELQVRMFWLTPRTIGRSLGDNHAGFCTMSSRRLGIDLQERIHRSVWTKYQLVTCRCRDYVRTYLDRRIRGLKFHRELRKPITICLSGPRWVQVKVRVHRRVYR